MKTAFNFCVSVFFGFIAATGQAQTASVPPPTPFSITHREANERTWQRIVYEVSPSGQIIPHMQSYEELANGLCYPGKNGQWLDSQEQITILPDGSAAATNGASQAYFPINIGNGTIRLTYGNVSLSSEPLGLMLASGANAVFIGELTNSVGELISSNEVLYTNAFTGVDADLLYTYRKCGLEQDVIFRSQPPSPKQFGLSSTTAKLELLTEFFNPPSPAQSAGTVNPQDGLSDDTLTFGGIKMVQGRAFMVGQQEPSVSVYKSWARIDGRTFLVEQVPYHEICGSLAALPASIALNKPAFPKAWTKRLLPPPRLAQNATNTVRLARAAIRRKPGFVFDYITIDSAETNYVFRGDSAYYITGPDYLYGTTVLEGGTIIKMNSNGQLNIDQNGVVDCETGPYLPAIFTSYNENDVGPWWGSGNPAMGDVQTFLNFNSTNVTLHDLDFSYALNAVNQTSPGAAGSINLWDCKFVDVATAANAYNVGLYNVLIGRNAITNAAVIVEGSSLVGENVTADYGSEFIQATNSGTTVALTNCLITGQQLLSAQSSSVNLQTNDVFCLPTLSSPVYQVVGGGSYYLTNSSEYATNGTVNIDPDLLADLQEKTVWPPIVYADTNISSLGILSPSVARDTNSYLAVGFHYAPLDYVFGGSDLSNSMTVTAGTAIGFFEEDGHVNVSGQPYALTLENGANLVFDGNATQPCYWAQYGMVQERGNSNNWNSYSGNMTPITFNGSSSSQVPLISALFTKFIWDAAKCMLQDNYDSGAGVFKNCEFYDTGMCAYDMQYLTFTNCLFVRNYLQFYDSALNFTNENCTYYDGQLALVRQGSQSPSWSIENTIFDGTLLAWIDNYNGAASNTEFACNAYNTNNLSWKTYGFPYNNWIQTNTLEDLGPSDVMVTNYNWETSWFGDFYLPLNSPLIYVGSTNANFLGLYHFTTTTNLVNGQQVPDGTNTVTIGYHYVATDQYGNPLDSNGDGIPDYLEDANGDGLVDNGETNWALAILIQPMNQLAVQGTNVSFNVTAGGFSPLSYQWYFAGAALAGQISAALPLDSVQTNNAGNYSVVVTNNFGAVTSSIATLTVLAPPTISITNPINNQLMVSSGTNVTLIATASDFAGTVTQVQFFLGTTNLGTAIVPPYSFVWTNALPGNYALTAAAVDSYGLVSTSSVVSLFISPLFTTNNLILWLRGDAIVGITNGGSVGNWPDSSGWGYNATQGTSGDQPLYITDGLNNLPVIQFNGTSSYLNLPNFLNGTTGAETFVVLKVAADPPASARTLWQLANNNEYYPQTDGSITEGFGVQNAVQYDIGVPAQPLTQYHVYEVSGQNGYWAAWINGILQYQTTNNTYGYRIIPTLGDEGNFYFAGDIAEIMIFNRPLTSGERATVNTYLNGKYGLVPGLPAAPTNLIATAISPTQVGLTWGEALTNGAARQIAIERSTNSSGPFVQVAEVSAASSYLDTNLTAGTTYYYEAQAVNLTQLSPASNIAQATTPVTGISMPLSSLILWLKADSGLAQIGTNAPVNLWADQSGNGNNATQATGTDRPTWISGAINGLPVIQFNGTSSYLNLPNFLNGTTGAEAFVVLKVAADPPASARTLWQLANNNEYYPQTDGSITEGFGMQNTVQYDIGVPAQPLTQYHVYEVSGQNGYWAAWINGILQYQTTNNTYGYRIIPTLGDEGNFYFAGDIAEIMIFNRPLTSGERATVNTYLNGKYGLVPGLPAAPTNLIATAISPTQVGLTWGEALTNGAARQIAIERSTNSSGPFVQVAEVSAASSYLDTNLTAGTTYYYEAQAVNLTQLSPASNIAQATTPVTGISMPLSSLILWLKADSGLAQIGTNAPVNLWADQSGNGNNATQATGTDRPTWISGAINGLPVIQFNGTSSYLNLPNFLNGTTGAEAFVVLKVAADPPASARTLWQLANNNEYYPQTDGSITEGFGMQNTVQYDIGVPAQPLTQYHVYEVSGQNGYWAAWINGILQYQTTNNTYGYRIIPTLGDEGNFYFAGDIAEIMIFNRPLSGAEKLAVGAYLFSKFNLSQFATNAVPPTAPTNLVATGVATQQLNLKWNARSTNETAYLIERKTGAGGDYEEVGSTLTTNFSDTGVICTNQYFYEVQAQNFFGPSPSSMEVTPPVVSLTQLSSNENIVVSSTNLLVAQASDPDYAVNSIALNATVVTNIFLGSSTSVPYTNVWIAAIYTNYFVTGTASDVNGDSWFSLPLSVNVNDGFGTPIGWYLQNGLNPYAPNIGTQDTEMGGLPNYQSYLYGASPVTAQGFSIWVGSPSSTSSIP